MWSIRTKYDEEMPSLEFGGSIDGHSSHMGLTMQRKHILYYCAQYFPQSYYNHYYILLIPITENSKQGLKGKLKKGKTEN